MDHDDDHNFHKVSSVAITDRVDPQKEKLINKLLGSDKSKEIKSGKVCNGVRKRSAKT